jgi:hypothetical protein
MKENIVEFKTVSPLFEMERDGIKPFTTRLIDKADTRFDVLLNPNIRTIIKIINPATGESFERKVWHISYVGFITSEWINIHWKHSK